MADSNKSKGKGRGWHGNSEEHAKIGRKGGQASAAARKSNSSNNQRSSRSTPKDSSSSM